MLATVGILAVFALDVVTGSELSVSIFFLVPIGLTAWFAGRAHAGVASAVSAGLWFTADWLTGTVHSTELIPVWNALVRLGFFAIVAHLLTALRRALAAEQDLSRRDPLTGLANVRRFHEVVELEISRSQRYGHPISLAYFDLDNFKEVNDRFGHERGDLILRTTAGIVSGCIRATDTLGRLGGDEFALVMPETGGDAAAAVTDKIQRAVRADTVIEDAAISLSLGCVTYARQPPSAVDLIRRADALMYRSKAEGKDRGSHEVH